MTSPTASEALSASTSGVVVVDKPSGWTSHDVVARLRRMYGTRRVGHAGTLDPMATGVLLIGVGRATKLLHHFVGLDKVYAATIRLGSDTLTDDAEGEVLSSAPQGSLDAIDDASIAREIALLSGDIMQVPSSVSAIKVDGVRSYARVRAGDAVELPARQVAVHSFDLLSPARRGAGSIDLEVRVACSSGTYIRALARDLGRALGVGGHLTRLRRESVGPFTLDGAHSLPPRDEDWAESAELRFELLDMAQAAAAVFPTRQLDAAERAAAENGRTLSASDLEGPVAAVGEDGALVAIVTDTAEGARPLMVVPRGGEGR